MNFPNASQDAFRDVLTNFQSNTSNPAAGLMGAECNNVENGYTLNNTLGNGYYLTNQIIDTLIENNALISKLINLPVDEMYKFLPDLKGLSKRVESFLMARYSTKYKVLFEKAQRLANRYGTAYIILNVRDNKKPSVPLNSNQSYLIDDCLLLTHEEVSIAEGTYSLYDDPSSYRVTPSLASSYLNDLQRKTSYVVHRSRILIFKGHPLVGWEFRAANYRHKPVWLNCFKQLQDYQLSLSASLNILKDYDVFLFKMKGLQELVSMAQSKEGDSDRLLYERLRSLVDGKSITRSMIVDMELEDGEFINREYDGINEIIEDQRRAFAECAEIPASILFASSQGNLFGSDSGLSDRYLMSSFVNKSQRQKLEPPLRQLFGILEYKTLTKPYEVYCRPTVEMTAKEEASLMFELSKSAASDVVSKILTPQQAARRYEASHITPYIQLTQEELEKTPSTYEVQENGAAAGATASNQMKKPATSKPSGENAKSVGSN